MEFPVDKLIAEEGQKYEKASVMIKYSMKIDEYPELLLEKEPKLRDRKLHVIFSDILDGKVKYIFKQ